MSSSCAAPPPGSDLVAFPDLGIGVTLPPYRDVVVDLPASPPGEHEFTCRSGILRGVLVVTEVLDAKRAGER